MQMIPAYSPQARGRSERNFGTWQGRLPQELRLAGISGIEGANQFLNKEYIAVFNQQFTVPPAQKETAFRRTSRSDLDWVFTVQTERVVGKDNTVAIGETFWQIEKSRFRSLTGSTVTIHQHLDGRVSIRYGPHVAARFPAPAAPSTGAARTETARTEPVRTQSRKGRGKAGAVDAVEIPQSRDSHRSHRPLEIPQSRDSHFPTAPTTSSLSPQNGRRKTRKPPSASRRGSANRTT